MNKITFDFISFIGLLLFVFIALFLINTNIDYLVKLFGIQHNTNNKDISYFSYGYIIFYAIMGGSLVFYGIEKMNSFIKRFIKHTEFASLVSVTFIIFCCFIYSALFKDILQGITGQSIEINEWDNVIGFLVGRIAIIAILYISFVK